MPAMPEDGSATGNEPVMSLEQRYEHLGKRVRDAAKINCGLTLSAVEVQVLSLTTLASSSGDDDEAAT
jgi:hypothetical protein